MALKLTIHFPDCVFVQKLELSELGHVILNWYSGFRLYTRL